MTCPICNGTKTIIKILPYRGEEITLNCQCVLPPQDSCKIWVERLLDRVKTSNIEGLTLSNEMIAYVREGARRSDLAKAAYAVAAAFNINVSGSTS